MPDEVMTFKKFVEGIGAMAETCRLCYENFLKVGFTSNQALKLTEKVLEIATLANQGRNPNDE